MSMASDGQRRPERPLEEIAILTLNLGEEVFATLAIHREAVAQNSLVAYGTRGSLRAIGTMGPPHRLHPGGDGGGIERRDRLPRQGSVPSGDRSVQPGGGRRGGARDFRARRSPGRPDHRGGAGVRSDRPNRRNSHKGKMLGIVQANRLREALDAVPRIQLALLPTPLQEARLSASLGGPRILVKRESLARPGNGGSKYRMSGSRLRPQRGRRRGRAALIAVGWSSRTIPSRWPPPRQG
ncbi:MAG: hypothetical protein MZV70_63900 [Desulfobacterales bacterium]|nr:hypothetical protein [Desulfobacterales bacterium]